MDNTTVYKIRHKKTGLWKIGGFYGGWNKNGKSWLTRGALNGHLAMLRDYKSKELPAGTEDWEIVKFEVVEGSAMSIPEWKEFCKK